PSRQFLAAAPKDRRYSAEELPDFFGLPMRMGVDCQLGKEAAENLHVLSRKLRTLVASSTPMDDPRPDVILLRKRLSGQAVNEWLKPEAVPALTQMLMAENTPVRMLLVELLAWNPDPRAVAALARRALFDISLDV